MQNPSHISKAYAKLKISSL